MMHRSEARDFFSIVPLWRASLRPESKAARGLLIFLNFLICILVFYQIFIVISEYLEFQIRTEAATQLLESIRYPGVAVCLGDFKRWSPLQRTSLGKSAGRDAWAFLRLPLMDPMEPTLGAVLNLSREYDSGQIYSSLDLPASNESYESFIRANTLSCSAVLKECRLDKATFNCCDGHRVSIGKQGKCIHITGPGGHMVQSIAGEENGLSLRLHSAVLTTPGQSAALHLTPEGGKAKVATGIASTLDTSVELTQTEIQGVPEPYMNCLNAKPGSRSPSEPRSFPSREACEMACASSRLLEECGCRFAAYAPLEGAASSGLCSPSEAYQCWSRLGAVRGNRSQADFLGCQCRSSCRRVKLQLTTQLAEVHMWPDSYGMLSRTAAAETAGVVRVTLYHEELEIHHIRQYVAYDAASLIGDIGMQIVMWLGLSIVGVLHSCFFAVFGCFERGRKPRFTPTDST